MKEDNLTPIRLIIAGGRKFKRYGLIVKAMKDHPVPDVILCGMAMGADIRGKKYGDSRGIIVEEYPADWEAHPKKAGNIRNTEMADNATHLLAFWDGRSTGTADMISKARSRGLVVTVIRY